MTLTLQRDADLVSMLSDNDDLLVVSLPIERTNAEINRITLKNAIRDAKTAFETERPAMPTGELLATLEQIGEHDAFLNPTYDGLAVIASLSEPAEVQLHPLWHRPDAEVAIGSQRLLTPLLRNRASHNVLLLHLANNRLHLFRGHFGELRELNLPEAFPESFDKVIELERQAGLRSKHSFHDRSHPQGSGTVHGEGSDDKLALEFQRRFLREVGNALRDQLQEGERVLLAGVENKLALFRQENDGLALLEQEIHGNFEERLDELQEQAKAVLLECERSYGRERLAAAGETGPELVVSDATEVAHALEQGRVAELFFNEQQSFVGREELAFGVLRTGGQVFMVDSDDWDQPLLAVLRW